MTWRRGMDGQATALLPTWKAVALLNVFTRAQLYLLVSQIVELRGDSKPLPFAYWLLGKHYSYLKIETLKEKKYF